MSLQQTDLNVAPFFDDYDETKNFHRVLFRPGKAAQARELTQAQTILQDQINRLGRHLFQEGSVVVPGGINAVADKDTISASIGGVVDESVLAANAGNVYITSTTSGIEARMTKYVAATQADPAAFAIDYIQTGTDGITKVFAEGESCKLVIRGESGDTILNNLVVSGAFKGYYVSVLPGVYFVRGHLVQCTPQDILATPFRNDQLVHVGFNITESIITETQDTSLLSNAQGYPNYKAPGAARLKIDLTLNAYVGDYQDNAFVEIVTFNAGELLQKVVQTDYNVINNALAQRQYETNGNFTVAPIPLSVMDHMRDEDHPDGVYPPEQGGNVNKLIYRLGRGVAYTQGFRSEIQSYYDIVADKAINTTSLRNMVLSTVYGSYLQVKSEVSLPMLDLKKRINLQNAGSVNVGSCLVRSVKREDNDTIRLYIMDLRFIGSNKLTDATKVVFQDASNNISLTIEGSNIFESSIDSMLFKLPFNAVKSLSADAGIATSYTVVRNYDIVLNGSGIGSVSLPANEYFLAINSFDYLAALTGSGTAGTQFTTSALSLGGTGGNKTLTVNVGATHAGKTVRVIAPVYKAVSTQKTKTLTERSQTLNFSNENSKILDRCDVYELKSVIRHNPDTTTTDVTKEFGMRSGSRPNWYENGSIYPLNGAKLTGTYDVVYDYFVHSSGDYFTVDSYGGMLREDIPLSSETADRTTVCLADCLDFRPLRDASTATGSVIGDFTSTSWLADIIDPNDNVRFDVTYYTNRIDIIYSAPDGSFGAARGIPADTPLAPAVPKNGMALYSVYVPAYTIDVTKCALTSYDNRRYTMRDIGKLEGRINNLEYYTSLNMLESKVERTQVIDPVTGLNRFKNGFTADNFQSTILADVYDPLWQASLDMKNGLLMGSYKDSPGDMIFASGTNHKIGKTVMKDFTIVPSIVQKLATETININPYAVFTWAGTVELFPSKDFWKDSIYLPPITTNNRDSDVSYTGDSTGPTAQQIRDYNNTVFHLTATKETLNTIRTDLDAVSTAGTLLTWQTQDGTVVTIPNTVYSNLPIGNGNVPTWAITPYTIADVPGYTPGTTLAGFPKPPAGVPIWSPGAPRDRNSVTWGVTGTSVSTHTVSQTFDDLLATAVIPWMRSIQIEVTLKGFRPFTKLYAFFNGVNVDEFVQQIKPTVTPLGQNVVVDAAGYAKATFIIPNKADMRFPTGEATLKFTDDQFNGATDAQSYTNGETIFTSGGTLETRRKRTVNTTITTIEEEWGWVSPPQDPIAQTFYVADSAGIWCPKIDLFFAKKAKNIPVRIQVRSVVAGLPSNVVAHGSNVTLTPDKVNISADGSVATSFVFDDPIFLEGKTEYAVVVLADTQEYEVYVATMGQRVIGKNLNVADQPNIGVFLTSSNSSTWSPDQLRDLTFVVHKCQFSTTTASTAIFNCLQTMGQLTSLNPVNTTLGSNTVRVYMRSHGLKPGDTAVMQAVEGGAGIPQAELIGNKTVTASSLDWFEYSVSTNANATAAIGGVCSILTYYPVTEFIPLLRQLTLPGTSIAWEYQYVSQATRATSAWIPFNNTDETTGMLSEGVIRQAGDFKIRATLTTTDPNLTPQIHTHGLGLQFIGRRLTNDPLNPAYNYVAKSVRFDTPSTSTKMFIAVNLPGATTMKLFYKLLTSGSDNTNAIAWVEATPTKPIINQAKGFAEYEYNVSSTTPYVGYKVMVQFFGPDPVDCPIVQDFRTISLA